MEFSPGLLRRVTVFSHASDEELAFILEGSTTRQVEEGGFFFLQGDHADHAYVLTAGKAKLMQTNRLGQSVNLRTVYPWQLFGALGAVRAVAEYPASSQALEDSTALAVPSGALQRLLLGNPGSSFDLMQLMSTYLQEMQARYRELATERVEQRVCRAILRLAAQSGQKAEDGIELVLSRQDLAEMTGTTLHTVSRILAEWHRRRLIEAGRERIRILQPHALVQMADGLP